MHGLINRSIERFAVDTYGLPTWRAAMLEADLGIDGFEAMLTYEDAHTKAVLAALASVLTKDESTLLEDIGTYLVSHPNCEAIRRLLRFGGVTFEDFVHSIDDLPDRVRLAVANLSVPEIDLQSDGENTYALTCRGSDLAYGHVLVGLLRAMADDYGALAMIEHCDCAEQSRVTIEIFESGYAVGRDFKLSANG